MELMARYPDNYFDLAIVDPVYGDQVVRGSYMKNSSSKMAKNKNYNNSLWYQPKTKKSISLSYSESQKSRLYGEVITLLKRLVKTLRVLLYGIKITVRTTLQIVN